MFPVSIVFPYSRDFVVSSVSRHFLFSIDFCIQRMLLFFLFPDTLSNEIWNLQHQILIDGQVEKQVSACKRGKVGVACK